MDAVLHSLRAAAAAQQAVYAKMARQQQLATFDSILQEMAHVISEHFPNSATVNGRFIILPEFEKNNTAWETLILAYDIRKHCYLSCKQVPGTLCGL